MKESLISFETAKLAKEKGFPQREDENDMLSPFVCGKCWVMDLDGATNLWGHSNAHAAYAASTQSLLQKWLRDKHFIHTNPIPSFAAKLKKWNSGVVYIKNDSVHGFFLKEDRQNELFDSYEEALENGLQEALKLL